MAKKSQTQQPALGQPAATNNDDQPTTKAVKSKYFTKEGYEVEEQELDYVHVLTSTFTLSGAYDKSKHLKKHILDVQMWKVCRKEWPKQGIKYEEMLHCPPGTPMGFDVAKED